MHLLYLIPFYAKWHYTEGFQDLFRNWQSFIVFVLHFFSLGLLIRTWFVPFGRLDEEYKKGLNAETFFETLVANTLMRVVGFVLRTFVIVMGLFSLLVVVAFGPVAFVLWILAPLIIISLFTFGMTSLLL
ncbi:MAG: hypothetical protein A3C70_01640 [Candidatus Zambryskibacteria bacterium RIFCSPHIGHO2_02_FULL_43_14]|uniref:Uncharacterized protein n=1 Tax=Candidatus Zambryskibacteria bacterium RIFCSPHIGHO2_02_FULL_43_14 TaxID=1802748 RepID=A0A1G2TI34_9BACT|nr:MAG: hypothetical protein A2829_01465 [Candidatus Zambryskibacteria bacterium RIFCSPHIGHO2_01_FULL_43_60]OHA96947.1 MAG: hypothetical protein A3C70_01640 [Candidatus Zambryskibacteria bacterium RIFCSPHIGHO2_02_FULL_43_14]OHB03969.1 MAG: hypothetical protein A3B03_00705 [Candidatus Zambryskibacteria bacterium RIFCSPLOWO2_01_FULL_42_41]